MRITVKLLAGAGIAAIRAYWFAAGAQDREAHAAKPLGGDIIPARQVFDPYPVFNGIAVDAYGLLRRHAAQLGAAADSIARAIQFAGPR